MFHNLQNVQLDRRNLVQMGTVGFLGLSLPDLLRGSPSPTASLPQKPKSCIFIVQYGGCSQIDTFDMKPEAPVELRGPFKPISTSVPGTKICEHLPRLAKLADQYCIVRSMTHSNPGHDGGMHVCMTGHSQPMENTPYFGSVISKLRPATRNVPSYVWVQNLAGDVQPRYLHGGFLGSAHSPLRVGTDEDNPASPNFQFKSFDPANDLSNDRIRLRSNLLQGLEINNSNSKNAPDPLSRYRERATDLLTGNAAREAFQLNREPAKIRDRYGRHPLGQNLLLARRLIEAGTRMVTVTAWTGLPPGEKFRNVQTWDMHGNGPGLGSIFGQTAFGLGWALPRVDEALSALLIDLRERGLLEDTLVVMVGEFGRTPRISGEGRDHWPNCYSALLAGAGIRGGTVYGSTDRTSAYVKDNPVRPEDFGATVLHALGISPEIKLGIDGFTNPVSAGKPIHDLFS